jgi:hypothetical protein
MIITNKFNLPEPYFRSCQKDGYPRFDWDTFSVTELMKGTKEIILNRRFYQELEQDCVDMIWTVFGTAVHKVMEGYEGEHELAEERVSMEIPCNEYGIRHISGGFDLYNAETQLITDYKTTGVYSYRMKLKEGTESDWAKQLRVYWLILAKAGFPVRDVRNTVFLKDWSKSQARRDRSYPQKPIMNIDYEYNGSFNSEVAAYLQADLAEKIIEILDYKDTPENQIPDCSKDERWERDECWAIMKVGRKKAVKLHDSEFEAERHLMELGKGHYIEHRQGTPVKCIDYCSCASKCSFYQRYLEFQEDSQEVVNG